MSTEALIGLVAAGAVSLVGWLLSRMIGEADRRIATLEAMVAHLQKEQLDDTRILKDVGKNEARIVKLHERTDDLTARIIALEVRQ